MSREVTEITIDERGDETHESWIKLTAHKVSSTPGARLFDSEIPHSHYVQVGVHRCKRRRDLNTDWLFPAQTLMEFSMSHAQWGAFVSSFGEGGGVPATLTFHQGDVPRAPEESRLAESHKEVLDSGTKALDEIKAAYEELQAAFDENAGKKVLRDKLHNLKHRIGNGPGNMEFAAKSLTEHVENVITKARADLEGMVTDRSLNAGERPVHSLLAPGEDEHVE
jgi:hypothetical protein